MNIKEKLKQKRAVNMDNKKLDEMIQDLVYSVEWHTKQLEEKAIQLKALQQMKEGEK